MQTVQNTDTKEAVKQVLKDTLQELLSSMDHIEEGEEFPSVIVNLTDVSDSNWVKEGTEGTANPIYLAAPSLYCIMPNCKVALYDAKTIGKYRLEEIRYIVGCPSLDVKWQKDNGWEPTQDKQDNIWIKNGTETFLREGNNAVLYDYIRLYQGNANNPHRPPTAEIEFLQIIEKDEAEVYNVDFAEKRKAINIVGALQKEKPGGNGYTYDADKIDMYATIFDIRHLTTTEERFNYLAQLADTNPKLIVESVMNRKKELIADIKLAVDLSVIVLDNDKAFFAEGNTVILLFNALIEKPAKINKLAEHFLTNDGNVSYKQMLIKMESARDNTLRSKNN